MTLISDKRDRLLARLNAVEGRTRRVRENQYRAFCPAHPDRRPSLCVTVREDRILLHCFGGCRTQQVIDRLGLRLVDLFGGWRPASPKAQYEVARYRYEALDGDFVEKVRFGPRKAFRWRRPDPEAPHGFRWRLDGQSPSLYRLPYLIDVRQVLITEGEKAVDRLTAEGFVATCPPAGAGRWRLDDAAAVWRAGTVDCIVLGDHDPPGRRHALRVASVCAGYRPPLDTPTLEGPPALWPSAHRADPELAPLRVKLITLDGLPAGADVYDWFERGHTKAELRTLIDGVPYWTPESAERAKQDHRRELNRVRQQRFRARQRARRTRTLDDS